MNSTINYWRHPTYREIKAGDGKIHWLTVDLKDVAKPDGTLKKWFVGKDGLRYNRP